MRGHTALELSDELREAEHVQVGLIEPTESGVEAATARRLVQIARKVRHLTELSLMESVSTRLLVAAGKLIAAGVPPRLACIAAISEPLTDDADARTAIRQVIELAI